MGNSFLGILPRGILAGCGSAFNNQIRFTAAEGAGEQKALVHSWVLMFGLFAAFLGPWMIQFGQSLLSTGEYTGSLALLFVGLFILAIIIIGGLPNKKIDQVEKAIASRREMTIQSHIIAMYFPSLFSGFLLARLGIRKLVILGITLFLICMAIAYNSSTCHDYWWAMVLLGVGWNFLFLAGSTGISQEYTGPERFTAQGLNDALVYGTQAIASLGAGWLLFTIGWSNLVLIPIPILIGVLLFI